MNYQAAAELCEWRIPNCPNEATLHVGWLLDGGGKSRETSMRDTRGGVAREAVRDGGEANSPMQRQLSDFRLTPR